MVLPGGPDSPVPLAIAPDDLRQLADHDAAHRTFAGGAGPLTALDTGGEAVARHRAAGRRLHRQQGGLRAAARAAGRGRVPRGGPRPARAVRVARARTTRRAYSVAELGQDVVAVARVAARGVRRAAAPARAQLRRAGHAGPRCWPSRRCSPRSRCSARARRSWPAGAPTCSTTSARCWTRAACALVHQTLEQVAMTDPKAQAVPEPTREFYARRFLRNSDAGLRGMADAMLDRARPGAPSSPATGVPVLVAHGEADDAWLPHVQADMAHAPRRPARGHQRTRSTPPPSRTRPGRWRCCSTSGRGASATS